MYGTRKRKKRSKRGRASTKSARKKTAKRTTAKKAKSKVQRTPTGIDPLLDYMRAHGIEVTRANYLEMLGGEGLEHDAEFEAMLPEEI